MNYVANQRKLSLNPGNTILVSPEEAYRQPHLRSPVNNQQYQTNNQQQQYQPSQQQNYKIPTDMDYSVKIGLPYGEMPLEALTAKFEETNISEPEEQYDYYMRDLLSDFTPDKPTMAAEETRSSQTLHSKGFLNLIHSGTRGEAGRPRHSEMFLGDVDQDPRQANLDPRMDQMRLQAEARTRFTNFGTGNSDHTIMETHLRENQMRDALVTVRKLTQPRLKIFTTSKDGRKLGRQAVAVKKGSDVNRVERDKIYADTISDWAQIKQRSTTVLSNEIIRSSRWYMQNTTDNEFLVAKYGEGPRSRVLNVTENKLWMQDHDSGKYTAVDSIQDSKNRSTAMSCLMASAVNLSKWQEYDGYRNQDTTENRSQARKTGQQVNDIEKLLFQLSYDSNMQEHADSQLRKSEMPVQAEHNSRLVSEDAARPASDYLVAQKMYKTVTGQDDKTGLTFEQIMDAKRIQINDLPTSARKAARTDISAIGAENTTIEVDGKSLETKQYKTSKEQFTRNMALKNSQIFVYNNLQHDSQSRKQNTDRVCGAADQTAINPEAFASISWQTQPGKTGNNVIAQHVDNALVQTDKFFDNMGKSNLFSGRSRGITDRDKVRKYTSREMNENLEHTTSA